MQRAKLIMSRSLCATVSCPDARVWDPCPGRGATWGAAGPDEHAAIAIAATDNASILAARRGRAPLGCGWAVIRIFLLVGRRSGHSAATVPRFHLHLQHAPRPTP